MREFVRARMRTIIALAMIAAAVAGVTVALGAAGDVNTYVSDVQYINATSPGTGATQQAVAACPAGKQVIGGGAAVSPVGAPLVEIVVSAPNQAGRQRRLIAPRHRRCL